VAERPKDARENECDISVADGPEPEPICNAAVLLVPKEENKPEPKCANAE
jgi:hypothetical protein